MKSYLLESFRGGISEYDNRGQKGAGKMVKNANIRKTRDSLTCNQALVSEGETNGLVIAIVCSTDGSDYLFTNTGRIYQRNRTTKAITLKYTDVNGAITGAAEWYDNTGKTYLYWATATKLGRKELPGNADWAVDAAPAWKTDLTSASFHTMKIINGTLQICNDKYLAMVGYDNSYTNNSLNLIPGNVAKCLSERSNYAIIGSTRADNIESAGMFWWDQEAQNYNDKKILPVKGINAILDGELPLTQVGTDGLIYYADNINILPITRFPGGGQVNPDGVDSDSGLALFGVFGNGSGNTGIYSYGRKYKNHPFVLNLEYQFDCDEIGSVKKSGSDILVSYKSGFNYYVKRVDTTVKATATYDSLVYKAPSTGIGRHVNWAMVVLTMDPLPASCNVQVWYKVNQTGDWVQAKLEGGSTTLATGTKEAVFLCGALGKYFEHRIVLIPSGNNGPEIHKSEALFE